MKKKAVIISLNGNPAHVSHIVAYYKLLELCDFDSVLYVLPVLNKFIPEGVDYINELGSLKQYDIAVFESPCKLNLKVMLKLKFCSSCKIIYVYHEPLGSFKSFTSAGVPFLLTLSIFLKDAIHFFLLLITDLVLLPSKKAFQYYEGGIYKRLNSHYEYLPLLYDDEREDSHINMDKFFFSYIGGIAIDHAFPEFLNFIDWAISNNKLIDYKFLIASRNDPGNKELLHKLEQTGRLILDTDGPMTNEEINNHFASSVLVWNAYSRTTQSGVLAKSFMFGTPAIVMKNNLSEFVKDGENVVAIEDNTSFDQISKAADYIKKNRKQFSDSCRKVFEDKFFYRTYKDRFTNLLIQYKLQ